MNTDIEPIWTGEKLGMNNGRIIISHGVLQSFKDIMVVRTSSSSEGCLNWWHDQDLLKLSFQRLLQNSICSSNRNGGPEIAPVNDINPIWGVSSSKSWQEGSAAGRLEATDPNIVRCIRCSHNNTDADVNFCSKYGSGVKHLSWQLQRIYRRIKAKS